MTAPAVGGTLGAVGAAHRQVLEAQESLRAAVDRARAEGRTWQEIGEVLGTTKQAAFQRFGRPVDPRTGAPMADGLLPDAADRALAALGDIVATRFERVRATFDDVMSQAIDTEQLASVWAMVVGTAGAFERFGDPVVHPAGDLSVVDVLMEFEAGQATAQVSFRGDGRVAGLYIRPC
ncbi:DUF3887 domain-containing protein [Dactylosporangium sp. NPDC051541]|uniref:DUF3887 domain-containing protein n=1 Tax=Dactylosporangium sp. NPDC051541 TaxID=3363977 RepID=UPI00378A5CF3